MRRIFISSTRNSRSNRSIPEKTNFAKISDEKVKEKTGKSWKQWFKILDGLDIATNGHRFASMTLYRKHNLSPWWCQAVTIRYEWERGLRTVKNQREVMPKHSLFKNPPKKKAT
jgi:hypothetical protein